MEVSPSSSERESIGLAAKTRLGTTSSSAETTITSSPVIPPASLSGSMPSLPDLVMGETDRRRRRLSGIG
ncbi:unnamed protein product [Ilex paraguariensis]|uniref:Uncharacterized protein n=1 Tax=Ilex paraguariensis TaxID=185542 RepID=A0ABC8SHP1_9AQUA